MGESLVVSMQVDITRQIPSNESVILVPQLSDSLDNFIQLPASFGMTWILDSPRFGRRRVRCLIGISLMSVITLGICAAEAGWLVRNHVDRNQPGPLVDWTDAKFVASSQARREVYLVMMVVESWVLEDGECVLFEKRSLVFMLVSLCSLC